MNGLLSPEEENFKSEVSKYILTKFLSSEGEFNDCGS